MFYRYIDPLIQARHKTHYGGTNHKYALQARAKAYPNSYFINITEPHFSAMAKVTGQKLRSYGNKAVKDNCVSMQCDSVTDDCESIIKFKAHPVAGTYNAGRYKGARGEWDCIPMKVTPLEYIVLEQLPVPHEKMATAMKMHSFGHHGSFMCIFLPRTAAINVFLLFPLPATSLGYQVLVCDSVVNERAFGNPDDLVAHYMTEYECEKRLVKLKHIAMQEAGKF